jgi:AcrR family transcriptional regulator
MTDGSGQQTSERILGCAEELFGRRGYEAVTVADIAQACGVSTALIYYHYTDKESLLRALVDRASEVFDVHVRRALEPEGTARERLSTFIAAWLGTAESNEGLIRILVRPLTDPDGPLSAELLARIAVTIEGLAAVIDQGIDAGDFRPVDPKLAAECLFGLVNTRAAAGALNVPAESEREANAEFIAQLFFSGITTC